MLILPKIGPGRFVPPSLTDAGGLATEDTMEPRGWKDGASGLNLGPEAEKLNADLPGENIGAEGLILPFEDEVDGMLKWLAVADWGGFGWKLLGVLLVLPNANFSGLKLLVGLSLNSA